MARWLQGCVLACLVFTVFGKVRKPQNVRVHSVNLRHILQWDPPVYQGGNLTYTVQSISDICSHRGGASSHASSEKLRNSCQDLMRRADSQGKSNSSCIVEYDTCRKTVHTECMLPLSRYGSYCLRVRAELHNETSAWVSIHFKPMDQTNISSPSDIIVKSRAGFLDVSYQCPMSMSEPELEPTCLSRVYGSWLYSVQYWKKGLKSQGKLVNTTQTYAILSDLDPWTTYCLQVQASSPEYFKTGELSPVVCEKTSDDGQVPWWIKIAAFLLSMILVAGLVTGSFFIFSCIYRVSRFVFSPVCTFPQHLKEFLSQPVFTTPFPADMSNEGEDELCSHVTVESGCENGADLSDKVAEQSQDSHEHYLM